MQHLVLIVSIEETSCSKFHRFCGGTCCIGSSAPSAYPPSDLWNMKPWGMEGKVKRSIREAFALNVTWGTQFYGCGENLFVIGLSAQNTSHSLHRAAHSIERIWSDRGGGFDLHCVSETPARIFPMAWILPYSMFIHTLIMPLHTTISYPFIEPGR